jgi:acyl dehydratase
MNAPPQSTAEVGTAPTLAALTHWVGRELGLSSWTKVDQNLLDSFAACTGDDQWIHVDVERARSGPFGGTIAQGWLVASLLSPWTLSALAQTVGPLQALNYGVLRLRAVRITRRNANKLRFLNPVKSGSWVRGRMLLGSIRPRGQGKVLLSVDCTVEIDGDPKPALVATTLTLLSVA